MLPFLLGGLPDNVDMPGMHFVPMKCKMLQMDLIFSKPNFVLVGKVLGESDKTVTIQAVMIYKMKFS